MTAPTDRPTLGDLEQLLERHGVGLDEVRSVEIGTLRRGDRSSPLHLSVTVFETDLEGRRFLVNTPEGPLTATRPVLMPLTLLPEVADDEIELLGRCEGCREPLLDPEHAHYDAEGNILCDGCWGALQAEVAERTA